MTDMGAQVATALGDSSTTGVLRAHHPWAARVAEVNDDAARPSTVPSRTAPPRVARICIRCGDEFMVLAKEAKRTGRGKICSRYCGQNVKPRLTKRPTVQIRTLAPGTRFRIDTTEAEVYRQSPSSNATVVRYFRESKTEVLATWCSSVWVRVLP